jgi:hypothetical protein
MLASRTSAVARLDPSLDKGKGVSLKDDNTY